MNQKDRAPSASCNVGECLVGSCESHRMGGRGELYGANGHFAFFFPAVPAPACYSPSSPVQILEEPSYFFPDFPLYAGRHEAPALTVEPNGTIREKVGEFFHFFHWHLCCKQSDLMCPSFSSFGIIFFLYAHFNKSAYGVIGCLFIGRCLIFNICAMVLTDYLAIIYDSLNREFLGMWELWNYTIYFP